MNEDKTYHIDVTEEEDSLFKDVETNNKPTKNNFNGFSLKKAFVIVLGLHIVGIAALFGLPQKLERKEAKLTENSTNTLPTPQPTPIVQATPLPPQQPVYKPVEEDKKLLPEQIKTKIKYTKEYTVKQGDNFYKIVNRFKLNPERLIKLNNIQDINKLQVGQKLKFMD
jgi:LysM repeat protein